VTINQARHTGRDAPPGRPSTFSRLATAGRLGEASLPEEPNSNEIRDASMAHLMHNNKALKRCPDLPPQRFLINSRSST
jgi:hypothetical protein